MIKQKAPRKDQSGFTILELLIALTVFSIMLLLTSGVIVELSRQFYKGVVRSRTQETARNIVEEISTNIQYSASSPVRLPDSGDVVNWCIANRRYSALLGRNTPEQSPNGFVRGESCDDLPPTDSQLQQVAGDVELLGDNMRISDLSLSSNVAGNVWRIDITVAHGDNDSLENPESTQPSCRASIEDSTYCSVSTLSTIVVRKL